MYFSMAVKIMQASWPSSSLCTRDLSSGSLMGSLECFQSAPLSALLPAEESSDLCLLEFTVAWLNPRKFVAPKVSRVWKFSLARLPFDTVSKLRGVMSVLTKGSWEMASRLRVTQYFPYQDLLTRSGHGGKDVDTVEGELSFLFSSLVCTYK